MNSHAFKFIAILGVFYLFTITEAEAQIINFNEMPRYYHKTARMKNWRDYTSMRDVFHSDKLLMGRNIFSGNVSFCTGRVVINDGKDTRFLTRNALCFFTRTLIVEEFSINTSFYKNFNQEANAQWISDYTYSIGRYNWRPKKINYGYENYINNRYGDDWKTIKSKFLQGYYFVSYGRNLTYKIMEKIRIDSTSNMRFNYFVRYSLQYRDQLEQVHRNGGKITLGIASQYTIARSIYIESAVYYYPNSTKVKQPWDPDYSFGFGYFDYRPFRFSLTYGNWVINRFPWSTDKSPYTYYGLLDGNLKLMFNYSW